LPNTCRIFYYHTTHKKKQNSKPIVLLTTTTYYYTTKNTYSLKYKTNLVFTIHAEMKWYSNPPKYPPYPIVPPPPYIYENCSQKLPSLKPLPLVATCHSRNRAFFALLYFNYLSTLNLETWITHPLKEFFLKKNLNLRKNHWKNILFCF